MSLKIESKDVKKKPNKKIARLNPNIPRPPFRYGLIGPSKSGKTTLLCNLFDKKYYGKFWKKQNIIVFSRTVRLDDKLMKCIPSEHFFEEWSDEIIDEIVEQQEIFRATKKKIPHVLLILDDMLGTAGLSISSALNKFLHISRHYNISVIITSQKYTGIPRQMRLNLDNMSIFRPILSEMDSIIDEHINRSNKRMIEEEFMNVYREPYTFIHVNYEEYDLNKRYSKGFDEPLNLFQ